MLATTSPFPQFFDLDGEPLNSGSLFFGVANQNPETSPITVYWDAAGTQPASQPIQTINGFIVRNGTPATLFANSDYSMNVRNLRGNLVFYAPTAADANLAVSLSVSSGSSLVGFLQSGAGAVSRTVQSKLRDVVSIKDFGAIGNGAADDKAAIDAAAATGRAVFYPSGAYAFSDNITLPANSAMSLDDGQTWQPAATKNIVSNGFNVNSFSRPSGPLLFGSGTKSALNTQQFITGSTPTVGVNFHSYDSVTAGSGFQISAAILATRSGGTGNREALHVEQLSSVAAAGEFVVGANFIGRLTGGSGSAFGLNAYAWVDAAALATAELCGFEANTDARRALNRKVGIQIVDVATSISSGSVYDAGIIIGSQSGGAGYSAGLQFGFDGTTGFGILTGGKLIAATASAIALHSAVDFSGLTGSFTTAPILLPPNNKGIRWGSTGAGGNIESQTASNGGQIILASNTIQLRDGASTVIGTFTTTESYLMITTGSGPLLRRVEADAVDTAGVGYRNLRVGN